jgi:hypothetical protein
MGSIWIDELTNLARRYSSAWGRLSDYADD